ncbi:MAG: hypothetical protein ABI905_07830 [Betaproteobacteria bacterium]
MSIQDALAAHHRSAPAPQPAQKSRAAISIGNAGTLGEAVLARLLSAPHYKRVHVATTMPMRTSAPRLSSVDYADLAAAQSWPMPANENEHITDAVLIVGGQHSYFRRDNAFPIIGEEDAIALARITRENHCTRLMLIAPMSAWTAMTLGGLAHFDELERAIGAMGFETLVVVRPAAHAQSRTAGNWIAQIADALLSTLTQYMTSASRQPLRAQIVAQAAVDWFTHLPPGHHRQDATVLYEWLEKRKQPA